MGTNDKHDIHTRADNPLFDGLATIPLSQVPMASVGEELVEGRVSVYGDPVATFARIAQVWSGVLGVEVNATDVPLMLAGLKLVRSQVTPDYADNSDDVEGYIDIFRQIVGPDMVHARTVDEYLKKRASRG